MLFRLVGQLGREILDFHIGWRIGHLEARRVKQVLAIERKRAFGIEWHGVKLAIHRQTGANRLDEIVIAVIITKIIDRQKPASLAPDWRLVTTNGQDIELAALGSDIGRDALTQHVFFKHNPVDFIAGRFFPLRRQFLHDDHVTIIDRRDGELFRPRSPGHNCNTCSRRNKPCNIRLGPHFVSSFTNA